MSQSKGNCRICGKPLKFFNTPVFGDKTICTTCVRKWAMKESKEVAKGVKEASKESAEELKQGVKETREKMRETSKDAIICGVCGFASLHPKGALRDPFANPGAPLGEMACLKSKR